MRLRGCITREGSLNRDVLGRIKGQERADSRRTIEEERIERAGQKS